MNFSQIFKDIIIEQDTNIKDISENTGIDDSILYDYLNGSVPKIAHAVTIANHFHCSLNYLFGLDDEPNRVKFKTEYDITLFSDRYDNLLNQYNVSHFRLSKEKGLNYSSHYAWQRGSIPSILSLIIIAKYFDVSIDYLVGRTKTNG